MGSWYGTCGLTQLPLTEQEVVMIPLELRSMGMLGGADHRHPHDLWVPKCVPVYGVYDDYGNMEMHKDQQRLHDINVGVIADNLVEQSAVDHYEPAINVHTIRDAEVYQSAIHAERLLVTQHNYGARDGDPAVIEAPVGRMYIIRTVWDELVKNGPKPRWKGEQVYDKAYYHKAILEIMNAQPPSNAYMMTMDLLRSDNRNLQRSVFVAKEFASEMQGKQRDAFVQQYADQMAEMYVIDSLMHGLRKTWMPQAGAGSQTRDFHPYKVLMAAMQKSMDESIQWQRDNGWFDDEDKEE